LLGLGTIDPAFDNNKGNLIIPAGTNQDVKIGILRSGGIGEKHPATVEALFGPQPLSIKPSDMIAAGSHPVFWYVATGHKNSDEFFFHGGGFGTFYLNRVTIPAVTTPTLQGAPMSFNIEHSRPLNYTIKVVSDIFLDHGSFPSEMTISGTLPVGQDDIVGPPNLAWTINTLAAHITVTLTDTTLIKSIWERTYDFTAPTTSEP
jgi:hypothetical protein